MSGKDKKFMQVNNCMSTYNMGENVLNSFSGASVCVFMCQGASQGRFHCFKPNHLMPGATREYYFTSWGVAEGQT